MRSVLFVLLVGCGGGSKSAPPPSPSNQPPAAEPAPLVVAASTRPACADAFDASDMNCALATMEHYSASICTCKDKACADRVNDEMTKWGTEMASKAGAMKDQKPSPEVAKKAADIMTKYAECMTKLMMDGSTPPPDPCGGGADPCGG